MAMNMAGRSQLNVYRRVGIVRRCVAGFTLLEMMVVVILLAILTTLAVPMFSELRASQRASAIASQLHVALARARSEAVLRNVNVTLSPKSSTWQNGWQILDPANAANVVEDADAVTGATVSGPSSVIYQGSGRIQGSTAPSFLITASGGSTAFYQCVSVDLSGRPYMVASSTC